MFQAAVDAESKRHLRSKTSSVRSANWAELQSNCAGFLAVLILLAAPFDYGGTTADSIFHQCTCLFAADGLWLSGLIFKRRLPQVSKVHLVCMGLIFLQGWFMTFNAHSLFDREFWTIVNLPNHLSFLPGSVDRSGSLQVMVRLCALLLFMLLVAELSTRTRWMRRFVYAMAIAGAGLSLFGLWQKSASDPFRIWPVQHPPPTVFGTFWYHGNAAALLNMTWPLSLMAGVWAFRGQRGHIARAVWTAATACIFCGLAVNVSKAGHLIAASLLCVLVTILLLRWRVLLATYGWRNLVAFGGMVVIALSLLILSLDTNSSASRWREWLGRSESDSRVQTAEICMTMLPKAGLFGFGPGTFLAVFQSHVAEAQIHEDAFWRYAHNDWIQYFVEWGIVGGAVWIVFWAVSARAGLGHVWTMLRPAFVQERKRSRRSQERWYLSNEAMRNYLSFGASLALGAVLVNAAMDFPLQIMSLQIYAFTLVGVVIAPRHQTADSDTDRSLEPTIPQSHSKFPD